MALGARDYLTDVSLENYVKGIYHLGMRARRTGVAEPRVKTKALAEHLDVSLPSVTGMLRSLAEAGLVDYQPYKGVELTDEGRRVALRVVRNHRLIESFLVHTLGFTWDEVHEEAEVLEHAISPKLAAAIERYLGFPKVDPHGDPIPSAEGTIDGHSGMVLLDVPPNTPVRVTRIHDQAAEFLRYLQTLGLVIGSTVEVVEVLPFDGPIKIRCESQEATLSRPQVGRIEVQAIGSGVGS